MSGPTADLLAQAARQFKRGRQQQAAAVAPVLTIIRASWANIAPQLHAEMYDDSADESGTIQLDQADIDVLLHPDCAPAGGQLFAQATPGASSSDTATKVPADRKQQMLALRDQGMTLPQIASRYNISKQRVAFIVGPSPRSPMTIQHGTVSGYQLEARRGLEHCPECQAAVAAAQWQQRHPDQDPSTRKTTNRVAQHGTVSGYNREKRLGLPPCVACLAANAAETRLKKTRNAERSLVQQHPDLIGGRDA